VASVLDIHADVFVSVAFARPYNDQKWKPARIAAREMITGTFSKDVLDISMAITQLCRLLAGRETAVPSFSIRQQIWAKSYASLQINDFDGISAMISIVARSAHLDSLNKQAFNPASQKAHISKSSRPVDLAVDEVNRSLTVIRSGFLDILSKYANYNASTTVLDLLRRPSVVKDIMALMLSPVEDLQVAAQTLVGQAFDVDVRLDCFRALLENVPDAALDGIFEFLETFIQYSPVVPEACNLSKSLVRCLTDIIEALCAGHDGLLHNDQFLRVADKMGPASALPKLWALMAKSITVIFKRTPLWSTYFENEDMIVWMRDALIFGRDMLAQRRVIESAAALAAEQPYIIQATSPKKPSRLGQQMVNDLQEVLPELARWLRLTDEELLHQSFALLQSLLECFRESNIMPASASIAKLNKHIDDARKKDPNRPQTRLDSSRLSKLEDALAVFEDDIQIIDHIVPPLKQRDTVKSSDSKAKSLSTQTISKQTASVDPRKVAVALKASTRPLPKVNFTALDQQKLDRDVSLPIFRRQESVQEKLSGASSAITQQIVGVRSGAGLKGEHTAKKQTEESSSSEDSDSEEEESQTGLAALGKFQVSPKIRKPAERRQVKMLDILAKGKKSASDRLSQRHDARRIALRLKPDISGLHRALLSWDYDHIGPEPPVSGEKLKLVRVPDKFFDHILYRSIFEPLLLMECWSQIVQSKDEKQEICDCKITSRQFIDDWLDIDASISEPVPKDWYLAETDVVLLRHLDGKRGILAKVRSYQATPRGIQACLRSLVNHSKGDPGLHINSSWQLSKVFRYVVDLFL
jgi:senataxin